MIGLELIRKQSGMSLADLSKRLGVSRQFISKWERGEKSIPEKYLCTLAEIFGFEHEILQKELDEVDKLKMQSIQLKKAIDDSSHEYTHVKHDDFGKEVEFAGTYLDINLIEELERTNEQIEKLSTIKKISNLIQKSETYDLTDQLLDRFADIFNVTGVDHILLLEVIRALELHFDVNVKRYGSFGKENLEGGRVSNNNVRVEQLLECFTT